MHIRDLNGKSVCILGYGKEGKAMECALKQYAPNAHVTIRDQKDGDGYLDKLDQFDVVIKSPGIPPSLITNCRSEVTNSTQIFLDSIDPRAVVVGVTGSKGKSTTASLIYAMIKEAGRDALLIGNIGEPAIAHIGDIHADTIVVAEMSSYQLMLLTCSPHIAVITSFFPEHLDYHGSLDAYREAKKHIACFQSSDDVIFFPRKSKEATAIAGASSGRKIPYDERDSPVTLDQTHLIGNHNLINIGGASAVARHLGVADTKIIAAVKTFTGLPHRLQDLGVHHKIRWVDDAISTTPESTIAALEALQPNVKVLILGGQDRGNDFMQLGKAIDASKISSVILMGQTGRRIKHAIEAANTNITCYEADSMEEAVKQAKFAIRNSQFATTPIVLLSPASPSYDQYKNFEEKGDLFRSLITDH